MDNALNRKVAIVTGAGRGLGRAMALGLAGAQVLALAARETCRSYLTAVGHDHRLSEISISESVQFPN
jgi:NAD(P)-dependent dehydrogenase (short-subunit alcohol dehydrogenase family)